MRYIFGNNLTLNQTKILTWLLEQKQLGKPQHTKTAIRRGPMAGRAKTDILAKDMVTLTEGGYVEIVSDKGDELYQATGKQLEC